MSQRYLSRRKTCASQANNKTKGIRFKGRKTCGLRAWLAAIDYGKMTSEARR